MSKPLTRRERELTNQVEQYRAMLEQAERDLDRCSEENLHLHRAFAGAQNELNAVLRHYGETR